MSDTSDVLYLRLPVFVDERDQPRSPSISDVLAKLQEIEEKIDALKVEVDCLVAAYD